MQTTELKEYVKLYESIQDIRTALGNRIGAFVTDDNKDVDYTTRSNTRKGVGFEGFCLNTLEEIKEYEALMLDNVYVNNVILATPERKKMYLWLTAIKGIGHIRACGIMGYIEPVSRFDTVSKLWAYSGFGVIEICTECNKRVIPYNNRSAWIDKTASRLDEQNQKKKNGDKKTEKAIRKSAEDMLCSCNKPQIKKIGQRRIKGQLADFNPALKKQVYLCVDQFVKGGGLYKTLYKEYKENYLNRPDLKEEMEGRKKGISKGTARIDAMARRKVAKMFLSHIWQTWREIEGLPVTKPYVFDVLGHSDVIEPETRWSELDPDDNVILKSVKDYNRREQEETKNIYRAKTIKGDINHIRLDIPSEYIKKFDTKKYSIEETKDGLMIKPL